MRERCVEMSRDGLKRERASRGVIPDTLRASVPL